MVQIEKALHSPEVLDFIRELEACGGEWETFCREIAIKPSSNLTPERYVELQSRLCRKYPSDILKGAFTWSGTAQGFVYWHDIWRKMAERGQ